mmetsp:Transcript_36551/g.108581  ORF Transcript_36551/g.108581 Transcript_36551/m.108581 type:complete len:212 (+) Transcript_36551:2870-3505(+)
MRPCRPSVSSGGRKPRERSSPTSAVVSPLRSTWLSSRSNVSSLLLPKPHARAGGSRCFAVGGVCCHSSLRRKRRGPGRPAPAGDCHTRTKLTLSQALTASSSLSQKVKASSKSARVSRASLCRPSCAWDELRKTSSVSSAWPTRKPAAFMQSSASARLKARTWISTARTRSAHPGKAAAASARDCSSRSVSQVRTALTCCLAERQVARFIV